MKTKQLFLMFAMLIATFITASAQMMPPIPVDKDVRIGKLDNGLTYYIRYNNWPEDRAEFFIAQRVGAIQEEDSQRSDRDVDRTAGKLDPCDDGRTKERRSVGKNIVDAEVFSGVLCGDDLGEIASG